MDYQSQIHIYPVVSPQRIQSYKQKRVLVLKPHVPSSNTTQLNKALQFFQTPCIHPKGFNLEADVLMYCIWHVWGSTKVSENIYSLLILFCHCTLKFKRNVLSSISWYLTIIHNAHPILPPGAPTLRKYRADFTTVNHISRTKWGVSTGTKEETCFISGPKEQRQVERLVFVIHCMRKGSSHQIKYHAYYFIQFQSYRI